MRICIDKSGKLIEMQSDATEGTLIQNALNTGHEKEGIEEREVTAAEWRDIFDALPKPEPPRDRIAAVEDQVNKISDTLVAKSILTAEEVAVSIAPIGKKQAISQLGESRQ